jgi:hypothetical protein
VFRPVAIEGLRSSNIIFPQRLKDYIRAELKLPLESVVVVKAGDKPLQRKEAATMAVMLSGVMLVGALWIVKRFRRVPASPPPLPAAPTQWGESPAMGR